nr:CcdB family protein [Nitratireductor arenosus]
MWGPGRRQDRGARRSPPARLNPVLAIDGAAHVMATQFLAAVPRTELGEPVANLLPDHDRIVAAFDMPSYSF